MTRRWQRGIPALLASVAILAVAAGASSRSGTVTQVPALPSCGDTGLPPADAQFRTSEGWGVLQPIDLAAPIAACSLGVICSGWASFSVRIGMSTIVAWDPLALAPDPTIVTLRSQSYTLSGTVHEQLVAQFLPVVIAPVSHVADPIPATLAVNYVSTSTQPQLFTTASYWTNGPAGMPSAFDYLTDTSPVPLPGKHPVLAMRFCDAEEDTALRVLQGVGRSTVSRGTEPYEYLQKFRVPHRGTLHWVELPIGAHPLYDVSIGAVEVLDGTAMPEPMDALPTALFQADYLVVGLPVPSWTSHAGTPAPIVLEPEHDYWLLFRTSNAYSAWARALTGTEGADFTSRIGPLYSRTTPTGAWQEQPGLALSFRLIGEPDPATLAVRPTVGPAGLRLAAEPNPARGAAMLRWSGARGAVRLEVMDARGRRAAAHDAAGEQGSWLWRGVGDAGTPAAAGVYFLRATDGEGTVGLARVTLVR